MQFRQEDDQVFVMLQGEEIPMGKASYPSAEILGEYLPHLFRIILEKDDFHFTLVTLDDHPFLIHTNIDRSNFCSTFVELRSDNVGMTLPQPIPGVNAKSAFPLATAMLVEGIIKIELHHYDDPFLDVTQTLLGRFCDVIGSEVPAIQ